MAYKTCPDCGSRMFEYGCINCNEIDYISMQDGYESKPSIKDNKELEDNWINIDTRIRTEQNGEPY